MSGEWGGVMGSVVKGDYPTALSSWYYIYERHVILDFVTTTADYQLLALTPQAPEVDTGLFIRPFTPDSWTAIGVMSAIILGVLIASYFSISDYEQTSAYMISYISAWFFFVLLNAFYGGALTMFFSSEITIPFEEARDVIKAYPTWNFLMLSGTYCILKNIVH